MGRGNFGATLLTEIHSPMVFSFLYELNLLKPTGYVLYQQILTLNNCTLCPHGINVFCIYMKTNRDLCHFHDKLISLYTRDEKCLMYGTNRVFK